MTLGGLCGVTGAYLSMIENGKRSLDKYSLIVTIASALGVPPGELAPGMPDASVPAGRSQAASPAPNPEAQHGQGRVIQALDFVDGESAGNAADTLAELVDHYSHAICAAPPAAIYDELLKVRSYANAVIERGGHGTRRADLVLAGGWLSNLLAVAACDMGEHAAARIWCSDSQRRSQELGNPELGAWAMLTRALIAFYQGQSRQSVTLAARGKAAVPIGTVAHAKLAAQEMRAAAQAGDPVTMRRARSHAARAIDKLPPGAQTSGAFSIALGEDPPYTATSLLLVGQFTEAVSATNRVISLVYQPETRQRGDNPSGYARSLLILALAQAGSGRLDEAAAGHDALASRRPAWPTMVLAGHLDQALARDYAGARQAAAYHARYMDALSQSPVRPDGPAKEHR
jgi:transcriptional regulator with XRE-family HTH domain